MLVQLAIFAPSLHVHAIVFLPISRADFYFQLHSMLIFKLIANSMLQVLQSMILKLLK
jgi:hypothetical protein